MTDLKRVLSAAELAAVLRPLGNLMSYEALAGGMFASVVKAELASGETVVVKAAPPSGTPALLSYEARVIEAEAEALRIGTSVPGLRLPRLRLFDESHEHTDVAVLVTDFVTGVRWDEAWSLMSDEANQTVTRELGATLASYANVKGMRFGYVSERASRFTRGDWYNTFREMMHSLILDAASHGLDLDGDRVMDAVDAHRGALEKVREPRLVHGDLWSGNTFVDPVRGKITGVIDCERSLWGDPLFDIAGTAQLSSEPPADALLDGYNEGGYPVVIDAEARSRLALYRLWFATAMRAEAGPRPGAFPDLAARQRELKSQAERVLQQLEGGE